MPDRRMTVHALDSILRSRATNHDSVHEITVASETGFLQNMRIVRLYQNGLVKVLEREALRVVVAVDCLGNKFLNRGVWQVAIRTSCYDMVA